MTQRDEGDIPTVHEALGTLAANMMAAVEADGDGEGAEAVTAVLLVAYRQPDSEEAHLRVRWLGAPTDATRLLRSGLQHLLG